MRDECASPKIRKEQGREQKQDRIGRRAGGVQVQFHPNRSSIRPESRFEGGQGVSRAERGGGGGARGGDISYMRGGHRCIDTLDAWRRACGRQLYKI